jgi:hypothetical protein
MIRSRWVPIFFFLWLTVAVILFVYPLYVIRPFRAQGASELAVALAMMHARPWAAAICVAGSLATLLLYWRKEPRRPARLASLGCVAITALSAGLSFVNIYEIMFHPAGKPAFERVTENKLGASEMVLAVHAGGTARAYPIRAIAYHHIVNDVIGGVPIAATY